MFISVCAFSLMDLIVKWSDSYPIGQVLFFRGFFGIIPLLFLIPKDRYLDFYKTNRPFLHFKRCFAGLIALISIFIALRTLPLATVVSISFGAPIFTTVFSIDTAMLGQELLKLTFVLHFSGVAFPQKSFFFWGQRNKAQKGWKNIKVLHNQLLI